MEMSLLEGADEAGNLRGNCLIEGPSATAAGLTSGPTGGMMEVHSTGDGVHRNRCPFFAGQMMTPGNFNCRGMTSATASRRIERQPHSGPFSLS